MINDNAGSMILESIPEYGQILNDLSKGNLNVANFDLTERKSKLNRSLKEILFDENNDELPYFILFMDSNQASSYVKFLLDVNNFEAGAFKKPCSKTCPLNATCDCFQNNFKNLLQDALCIFEKYLSKDAKYSIEAPDHLVNEALDKIHTDNQPKLVNSCFDPVKQHALDVIQNQFYDKYLIGEYHSKYLLSIFEQQNLNLSDVLFDNIAVVFFLEYLEQESVSDLLKFFIQAETFSRNLTTQTNNSKRDLKNFHIQCQNDAMIIYDNFISLQANKALGFDDLIRRQVEMNICQIADNDKQDLDYILSTYSNCFYVPMLIVHCVLEKVFFPKFLNSALFSKYVNEIRANCSTSSKRASQSSSEHQVSTKMDETTQYDLNESLLTNYSSVSNEHNNNKLVLDESIWNLSDYNSPSDYNSETANTSNIDSIKRKIEKFKNMISSNVTNRRKSKSIEYDYETAEKIAAQLIDDVIKSNQIN